MKPQNLKTRIFLDGGNPEETREVIKLLGFLDGQTTNPTLIAKNPEAKGKKFSAGELIDFYRTVVTTISGLIPGDRCPWRSIPIPRRGRRRCSGRGRKCSPGSRTPT